MNLQSQARIFTIIFVSFFLDSLGFLRVQFDFLNIGVLQPDFSLLFLIYISFYLNRLNLIWTALIIGLLQDGGSAIPMLETEEFSSLRGIHSLVYILNAYALSYFHHIISLKQIKWMAGIIFVLIITIKLEVLLLQTVFLGYYSKHYNILLPSLYTTLIYPLWYIIIETFLPPYIIKEHN